MVLPETQGIQTSINPETALGRMDEAPYEGGKEASAEGVKPSQHEVETFQVNNEPQSVEVEAIEDDPIEPPMANRVYDKDFEQKILNIKEPEPEPPEGTDPSVINDPTPDAPGAVKEPSPPRLFSDPPQIDLEPEHGHHWNWKRRLRPSFLYFFYVPKMHYLNVQFFWSFFTCICQTIIW